MQPVEAIKQKLFGRLFEDGVFWVGGRIKSGEKEWFGSVPTNIEEPTVYYVRYALTIRGSETPILPTSIMDDWGNDMGKLKIYRWLRDEGDLYPRSEVFGFDLLGREVQHFVRELELHDKYPCYAYTDPHEPIKSGQRINTIAIFTEAIDERQTIKPPKTVPIPLRRSNVKWLGLPTSEREFLQKASFFR